MIEWNKVIYADCMNEENGLPTLEDKSVDLGLTDFPYNVNLKDDPQRKERRCFKEGYNDFIKNYPNWCLKIFNELERICKMIIFSPGTANLKMWYNITTPKDFFFHYKSNGQGYGTLTWINKGEIYLLYGQLEKKRLPMNYIKGNLNRSKLYCHPCPKPISLWYKIVYNLQPKSVIDPFLGSGTTAEVCTKLGIAWLGYEINEVYSQDINKRLKGCKKEPIQMELIL